MNDEKRQLESQAKGCDASSQSTNPNLTASLSKEYEALLNDLAQAKELTTEYQGQLAGKSNELGSLKVLFEKTQSDLVRLQKSIMELREERHRLANDVMRGAAFEIRCKNLTAEKDALSAQFQALQNGLAAANEEVGRCARMRDEQIAWFTLQLQTLNQQKAAAGGNPDSSSAEKISDQDTRLLLANIASLLERLMGRQNAAPAPKENPHPESFYNANSSEESICISYEAAPPPSMRVKHSR